MTKQSDFEFYLRFVKPLVLSLAELNDRVLAAAWVQKLLDSNAGTEKLRTTYLKALLFVLNRKSLCGPFLENPNSFGRLAEFSESKIQDVAKQLMEAEEEPVGELPPCSIDTSADFKEYAAAQDIPDYGIHVYYAFSPDPMQYWSNTNGTFQNRGAPVPGNGVDTQTSTSQRPFDQNSGRGTGSIGNPSSRNSQTTSATPNPHQAFDERLPSPTWGSNLVGLDANSNLDINWRGPEEELLLTEAIGSEVTQAQSSAEDESTTSPLFGRLEKQLNDLARDEDIAWLSAEKYLEQYKDSSLSRPQTTRGRRRVRGLFKTIRRKYRDFDVPEMDLDLRPTSEGVAPKLSLTITQSHSSFELGTDMQRYDLALETPPSFLSPEADIDEQVARLLDFTPRDSRRRARTPGSADRFGIGRAARFPRIQPFEELDEQVQLLESITPTPTPSLPTISIQLPTPDPASSQVAEDSWATWPNEAGRSIGEESPPTGLYESDLSPERDEIIAEILGASIDNLLFEESPPAEFYAGQPDSPDNPLDLTYEILMANPPPYYRQNALEVRSGIASTKPVHRRSRSPAASPILEEEEKDYDEDLLALREKIWKQRGGIRRRRLKIGTSQKPVRRRSVKPNLATWLESPTHEQIDSFEEMEREFGAHLIKSIVVPAGSPAARDIVDTAARQYDSLLNDEDLHGIIEESPPKMEFEDDDLYFDYRKPSRSPTSPPVSPTIFDLAADDPLLFESPPGSILYSPPVLESAHDLTYRIYSEELPRYRRRRRSPVTEYPEEEMFRLREAVRREGRHPYEAGRKGIYMKTRVLERRSKAPKLQTVDEWIDYPDTPLSRYPAEVQKRRRVRRRHIIPARLDFGLEGDEDIDTVQLERLVDETSPDLTQTPPFVYDPHVSIDPHGIYFGGAARPGYEGPESSSASAIHATADAQYASLLDSPGEASSFGMATGDTYQRQVSPSFQDSFERAEVELGIRKPRDAGILRVAPPGGKRQVGAGGVDKSVAMEEVMVEAGTSPNAADGKPRLPRLSTAEAVFLTLEGDGTHTSRESSGGQRKERTPAANIFDQAVFEELIDQESPPLEMYDTPPLRTPPPMDPRQYPYRRRHEKYRANTPPARDAQGNLSRSHSSRSNRLRPPQDLLPVRTSFVRLVQTPEAYATDWIYDSPIGYVEHYPRQEAVEEEWFELIPEARGRALLWSYYGPTISEVDEYLIDTGQLGEFPYEIAEPFEGRISPGPLDSSPMPQVGSFIEDDLAGFRWMR